MTILCLETATKVCSVALGQNGKLLALKESSDGNYSHAENLTLYIQEVCTEAKVSLKDIDAVAVSKGPGSFTGLRIGVSTAKGLCYALDKPLIAINSLEAMAVGAIRLTPNPSPQGEGNSPVYYTAKRSIWEGLKEYGREMRKSPTKAEKMLWEKIRNKKTGYKIRRQHAIDKFICDFVCLEKQLVIELDGAIHKFHKEEDKLREEIIGDKRFSVLRFTNEEVYNDINLVVSEIKKILDEKKCPSASWRRGAGGGEKNASPPYPLSSGEGERPLPLWGRDGDGAKTLFCPMIDAKRMEVYCAVYDGNLNEIKKTSAEIIDENSFADLFQTHKIIFFGDGSEKCKSKITHPNAVFIDNINPSAQFMIPLAEKYFAENPEFSGEDVAYFEPYYLKDFVGNKA